jgi:hypothetical protein
MSGQSAMHFNDPTVWALASLLLHVPYTQSMLDNFCKAGGVRALLKVLRESRYMRTIQYAVQIIGKILCGREPGELMMCRHLAEELYHSGEQRHQLYCTA